MLLKTPVLKDLVLLGGGHSHIEVLRKFGMKPLNGVRLTIVTRDVYSPYSGMLPGYISGFYSYDECHLDLVKLSSFAHARLVQAEANGIDLKAKQVLLKGRLPIKYDALSINIGITPRNSDVPGAWDFTTPVKPIDRFAIALEEFLVRYREHITNNTRPGNKLRIVVVGGGPGGVEVCLALQHRLEQEHKKLVGGDYRPFAITLLTRGRVLDSLPPNARGMLLQIAAAKGVTVLEGANVLRVSEQTLLLSDGRDVWFDAAFWVTGAQAASWLAEIGLPTDRSGFLAINEYMQSAGGPPEVFAVGDVASSVMYPRPKAGVYAVRQGPPLALNLRNYLEGRPLVPFTPQSTALALVSTGSKHAIGCKGWLTWEGDWLWDWKDNIDRTFMAKYADDLLALNKSMTMTPTPPLTVSTPARNWLVAGRRWLAARGHWLASRLERGGVDNGPEAAALLEAARKMRCGGCGSKVGSSVLASALSRLRARASEAAARNGSNGAASIVLGLDEPDDAALVKPPPPGYLMVQTIDFFFPICDDPYVFGKIAANHCLSDVYAMGGTPSTALALAVVPFGPQPKMEEELTQMLGGALDIFQEAGCTLVGGHTSEGPELGLGFSVNGMVKENAVMRKAGLQSGQVLVLTKPLGTGTIMAASAVMKAKGRWVAGAMQTMAQSSATAARILRAHGATGCTDVTGFGLLGHAAEMARASKVLLELELSSIPPLEGALDCIGAGVLSSLHPANTQAVQGIVREWKKQVMEDERWPLLTDPQTGGGLLAGIPAERLNDCLAELKSAGYLQCSAIGVVKDASYGPELIEIKTGRGQPNFMSIAFPRVQLTAVQV